MRGKDAKRKENGTVEIIREGMKFVVCCLKQRRTMRVKWRKKESEMRRGEGNELWTICRLRYRCLFRATNTDAGRHVFWGPIHTSNTAAAPYVDRPFSFLFSLFSPRAPDTIHRIRFFFFSSRMRKKMILGRKFKGRVAHRGHVHIHTRKRERAKMYVYTYIKGSV